MLLIYVKNGQDTARGKHVHDNNYKSSNRFQLAGRLVS